MNREAEMIGSVSQKESFRKITPTLVGRIVGYVARLEGRKSEAASDLSRRPDDHGKKMDLLIDLCRNKGI